MLQARKKIFVISISLLVSVGIFFCIAYVSSSVKKQKKLTEVQRAETVVDKILSSAVANTVSFAKEVVELSKGHTAPSFYLNDFTGIKQEFLDNNVDFIEANLFEMKVRVFKKNDDTKEFTIIKKGNPDSWGGTAAGIYKIESGFESSYSVASQVYMPYAMKFYGKYYLHGEPYYPGGAKLISDFSGGCLRLKDDDATDVYEMAEIKMPILIIDKLNDSYEYPKNVANVFPNVSTENYLVADLDSGFVFAEGNFNKKRPIASITKLMTSLVVAENVNLNKTITVKEWMLNGYGSSDYLRDGDILRVIELFYPLLVESSNNAAEVMSYFLGRENTIELMNEKTKSILMPNTFFTDVSGYDPGNISTPQDIFYLARYIKNNRPPIFQLTRGESVPSFGHVKFDIDEMWNKNVFSEDATFIGGKTGFIDESRYNGLFVFNFKTKDNENRNIAIILLGSQYQRSLKSDTQKIYIWLAKNYFNLK